MSTAVPTVTERPAGGPEETSAGSRLPVLGDPAERGDLSIADKVVERIAGHAVTQVEGASAAPRRLLGVPLGSDRPDQASVDARVDGRTVTIDATVAIGWPASIRGVVARLRSHVRGEIERLTGMHVAHIDVDVVSMRVAGTKPRRVL